MGKILIVDDEEKITRLYKLLLIQAGYRALEAHDSHDATHILITQRDVCLVLLDIHLPQVDGATLYEVVKQYDPQIKVMVTSVDSLEDQKRSIGQADDYYEKTQDTEILLSKVKEILRAA